MTSYYYGPNGKMTINSDGIEVLLQEETTATRPLIGGAPPCGSPLGG